MSELLEVRGLSKKFGNVVTAEDVNFNGVLPSDAGTIMFDGHNITSQSAASRTKAGIARSFQIPRPFVDMTVFENVYVGATFGGGFHGQIGYEAAVRALETTGLMHLSEKPAGQLRLLDRKRLELARALATNPRLILLDEIAGGLTEKELPPLIELIRGLRDSGVTVVWIEHIVHALTAVVDELMCLALGRVLAIGDPQEVMRSPEVIEVYLGSTFDLGEAS